MATSEQLIPIPGRLHSLAPEGHVAGADEIYDDDLQKSQSDINADVKVMGASGENHSKGLVPDPGTTQGNTKYLREDGTWATPAGQDYTEGNGISISSNSISVKAGSNLSFDASGNLNAADTTYSEATTSESGLMSSSDKTKLDGIQAGAQVHIAPTANEVKTALGTTSGTTKYLREDGTWQEVNASPEVQLGGNTPSSESDIKLFVDESADDTVEVYTKAQADGQFVATVNMNTEPTESTLTYTATDGTTKSFKVGDEVRVPDVEADNGYTFYKLYTLTTEEGVTTATWDKLGAGGGGSAAGLEIVEASGTTLNAEVGKYYRYDSDVSTLAVTLPTITGATEVQEFKMYFHTASSNVSVTFTGGTIQKLGDFQIIANNKYEVDVTWNGEKWILQTNVSYPYDSKIAYIESTGTQYINTLYNPNSNTSAEMHCNIQEYSSYDTPFGSRLNQNSNTFVIFAKTADKSNASVAGFNTAETTIGAYNASNFNSDITIVLNSTKAIFGANSVSISSGTFQSSFPIYIFNLNHGGGSFGELCACKMKLYSFKLYENGVPVRDFIPVRIGTVGYLYDKIGGRLYGNSGTGDFVLGADV